MRFLQNENGRSHKHHGEQAPEPLRGQMQLDTHKGRWKSCYRRPEQASAQMAGLPELDAALGRHPQIG